MHEGQTMEEEPAVVPDKAKQAGEIRSRWDWTEPTVWTDRMLAALEKGVKGGKWFSLIDKVVRKETLLAAFARVKANGGSAGVDHQSIEKFEADLEANMEYLLDALRRNAYQPQPIRRVWIDKTGTKAKRPLGIPTIRDRVVQGAIRLVIEPIFERGFAPHSYGFRPNRGCKHALRRVDALLKAGYHWVVDADLKSYFDTIPHDKLMQLVETRISDGRVLELIQRYLTQDVLDSASQWTPEQGSPQGAVLSPLLSNIYLDPLDHQMAGQGFEMIRYADDFVLLCRSEHDARKALAAVQQWTLQSGLTLHPDKTRLVDATQKGGFDFLGYHFERGYRWPAKKSLKKLKDTIRNKTRRTNGHSLDTIIRDVNRTTRGWFEYFKHSHTTTFTSLDKWIRMRLRSILRRRLKLRGRGRGADHHRWPNAYFAESGLFSVTTAHASASPSAPR
jgi:RNA-directed DNA polymerase